MMHKRLAIISFLLILAAFLHAQNRKPGKITKDDWAITKCSFDTAANAIVLYDIGLSEVPFTYNYCRFDISNFSVFYERHLRIKILNDKGFKAGDVSFVLRSVGGQRDELFFFGGTVSSTENGKVVTKKFNADILAKECFDDGSCAMKGQISGLTSGCILDLDIQIKSAIINELPIWNFGGEWPVIYCEYKTSIPAFFQYRDQCLLMSELEKKNRSKSISFQTMCFTGGRSIYFTTTFPQLENTYISRNIRGKTEINDSMQFRSTFESVDFNSILIKKKNYGSI